MGQSREQIDALSAELVRRGLADDVEQVMFVDETGQVVHRAVGEATRAGFSEEANRLLASPNRRYTVMHNHPAGSSLSVGDVYNLSHPGVKALTAAGHDGSRYTVRPGPQFDPAVVKTLTNSPMLQELKRAFGGDMQKLHHAMNTVLQRQGVIGYEYELSPRARAQMERDCEAIERAVEAATKRRQK